MSDDVSRDSFDISSTPKASMDNPVTPQKSISEQHPPAQDADMQARMNRVLQSDIGIHTLLTRLKQSISSAREFSAFLKERASLEEKHFHGINRLTRSTQDLLGRPDNRQGSFAFNYRDIGVIHEKMSKNSEDFTYALVAMADELQEVSAHCERGRKQWKHSGLEAEQRAHDADGAMEKSKQRYFSLAEQYDRVRTGERQSGKFGLKGKSAASQEESLLNKAENADQEYRSRVEAAQAQRHDLMTTSRPQAIRELQHLIMECDAAVSMQLQKFAVLNEKLLLANGLCISPLKNQESSTSTGTRSLREVVQGIDNHRDFSDFVLSHSSKVGPAPSDIRYEKHPALAPMHQHQHQHHQQPPPMPGAFPGAQRTDSGFGGPQRTDTGFGPQRTDTGFGPQRPGAGPGTQRTDTGFGSMSGYPTQGGQTSGFVPNQSPQHGQFPGHQQSSIPHSTTSTTAPQLPQIGALSMGGKLGPEGNRPETGSGRGDNEYRDFSGPPQHRPGQGSYSGPPGAHNPQTINQQVTSLYDLRNTGPGMPGPMGGPNPATAPGIGRGQPQVTAPSNTYGPSGPGMHQHGRGPSLGQPSDFRQDSRTTQQPPNYPQQQQHQPSLPPPQQQLQQQRQPQNQQSENSPTYPRPGQNYQQQQPDPRGLPSQVNNGASNIGGPNHMPGPVGMAMNGNRGPTGRPNLPPLRPCFGVPLDELFRRDGAAVPALVYQCVQAVDLFGLNMEGVYRTSGNAQHVMELQALFDHDPSQVDFRTPAAFYNDIASVTTLLKHFLRDLPDPLLTSAQYNSFIQAAKLSEDIVRRDSLHAIINSLPDPNYATLRTLVLHLNRVSAKSAQNRMTTSNLAIVFGPTLMGGHGSSPTGEIQDAGWHARVIETILNNTMQIFDDDD